ncbi:MAG: alpha/beta-hydrolase family protein [Acidimicrobiia bacterium]
MSRLNTSDLEDRPLPPVFSRPVSRPGIITGVVFLILSLLPSMLPRTAITQGVISGVTFLVGYGLGAAGEWAWTYVGLPPLEGRVWRVIRWVLYLFLAFLFVVNLWRFVGFQNNLRDEFGMDRISPIVWLTIVPVAVVVAALLLVLTRAFRKLLHLMTRWLDRRLPGRLARVLGGIALALIIWGLWSGVLVNAFFTVANQIFAPRDAATNEGVVQPTSDVRSGGPGSLVEWEDLGRQGRAFVASGPTVDELNRFHGGDAMESVRVYVGLKSAETTEERARLLLEELIRAGGFDRDVLIVATTTGTGYLEPNAMTSLDYVHNGDVAIAGAQYSYLPSWISLLADQDEVRETSKVVFDTIHGYWSTLPEDARPEFYLYGLSLGSFGVESILTSIDIINEPIDGAVMVGPPFVNPLHAQIIADRDPGSSPPTPIYEAGRTVRFTNEQNAFDKPPGPWGETRVAYLQHASDPVVFFSPDLAFTSPDWLEDGQRGDEISDDFVWVPVVTMWQVLIDLASAGLVPEGYGHLYSKQANADAWIAVTARNDYDEAAASRLDDFLISVGPLE